MIKYNLNFLKITESLRYYIKLIELDKYFFVELNL